MERHNNKRKKIINKSYHKQGKICPCGKRLTRCTTCKKGGSICPCGKNRYNCIECSPQNFCECKKRKDLCVLCMPLDILLKRKGYCDICGITRLSRNRKKKGLCATCDESNTRRIEHQIWDAISKHVPIPSSKDNVTVGGTSCNESRRRPDFSWVTENKIIYLEIDEYSHQDRSVGCELGKIDATKWGVAENMQTAHTVFVRFNPHVQKGCDAPLQSRIGVLTLTLNKIFEAETDDDICLVPKLIYMFYGNSGQKHIRASLDKGFDVTVVGSEYKGEPV